MSGYLRFASAPPQSIRFTVMGLGPLCVTTNTTSSSDSLDSRCSVHGGTRQKSPGPSSSLVTRAPLPGLVMSTPVPETA